MTKFETTSQRLAYIDYEAIAQERNRRRRKLRDAAPDLLLALEALLEDALALGLADSHLSGSAIEAREAIAKARGD